MSSSRNSFAFTLSRSISPLTIWITQLSILPLDRDIFLLFCKDFLEKNVDFEDLFLPLGINETLCTIGFDEEIRDTF